VPALRLPERSSLDAARRQTLCSCSRAGLASRLLLLANTGSVWIASGESCLRAGAGICRPRRSHGSLCPTPAVRARIFGVRTVAASLAVTSSVPAVARGGWQACSGRQPGKPAHTARRVIRPSGRSAKQTPCAIGTEQDHGNATQDAGQREQVIPRRRCKMATRHIYPDSGDD
jgi:hypothetical protein